MTDGDLDITNGDLSFVEDREAIAQHLTIRLRTFLGESRFNRAAGAPYLQAIFGKQTPKIAVDFVLRAYILETPGITGVEMVVDLDRLTRELSVTGVATTIDGPVKFSEIITAEAA